MYQVSIQATTVTREGDTNGMEHCQLAVRVSDAAGNPVPHLTQHDFRIYALYNGSFQHFQILLFEEVQATFPATDLPGVYVILTDWVLAIRGSFVFAVAVNSQSKDPSVHGQGLGTLIKLAGHDDQAP
jgi:hypothetical protein